MEGRHQEVGKYSNQLLPLSKGLAITFWMRQLRAMAKSRISVLPASKIKLAVD